MTKTSEYFVTQSRDDGTTFVTLRPDRPEWLQDAVYDAHDGELPNDWRYSMCAAIVADLEQYSPEDWADQVGPTADSLTDIYNAGLTAWLSADLSRSAYADEFREDYGNDCDLFTTLRGGQMIAIERMASILVEAMGENMSDES